MLRKEGIISQQTSDFRSPDVLRPRRAAWTSRHDVGVVGDPEALVHLMVDKVPFCLRPRCHDGFGASVPGARGRQPFQADPRITLQKLPRLKAGSLSASTSALTLPKVVSGLCLLPS